MPSSPPSRYRRRILGLGALATGALYVIGAPFYVDGIEADLEQRVPTELADAGFEGVVAEFTAQDGSLTCQRPLDDPEGAIAAAFDVRGVRTIEMDRSCRVNRAVGDGEPSDETITTSTSVGAAPATTAPATTIAPTTSEGDAAPPSAADLVAAHPDLAFLSVLLDGVGLDVDEPFTLLAPSNAAFDAVPADRLAVLQSDPELLARVLAHHVVPGRRLVADLVDEEVVAADGATLVATTGSPVTIDGAAVVDADIEAVDGVVHVIDALLLPADVDLTSAGASAPVAVTWDGASAVLTGVMASEVERQLVVTAAVEAFGAGAVDDQTTVDPDVGIDQITAERLATLVRAMPANLRSGEVGSEGDGLYATGVYRTEELSDAFADVAATVEVEPMLDPPPVATSEQAAALETELNEFVAANPILFEPASAVLAASATDVLDRIAARLATLEGLAVVVEGHTDSDGDPADNEALSEARAAAVSDALVARGVEPGAIESVGLGSTQPVLVDGVEDKAASRRVEFRVSMESAG